jgi:hypothetical protein
LPQPHFNLLDLWFDMYKHAGAAILQLFVIVGSQSQL